MCGCDDGVVIYETPSCRFLDVPEGWVQVEACHKCLMFGYDLAAACHLFENARLLRCSEGALHAIAETQSRIPQWRGRQ